MDNCAGEAKLTMGIFDGFFSLGSDINKAKGKDQTSDTAVGVVSDFLPELKLDMANKDLLKITKKWEDKWQSSSVRSKWVTQADENEKYWLGEQFPKVDAGQARPLVDNIVFQSVETYLPAATRQNPEPLVDLKATEKKDDKTEQFTLILRNRLADWADEVKLRLKMKKAGRNTLLSLLGVAKMGWDVDNKRPACKIIRPKKLILDPDAITDEEGYTGKYVGEYRKLEASMLISILEKEPDSKDRKEALEYIEDITKGELGTDVQFIEWWTDEYTCWTCNEYVLMKKKNLHWNWENEPDGELSPIQPEDLQTEGENSMENGGMMDEPADPMVSDAKANADAGGYTDESALGDETAPQDTTPIPTGSNHFFAPRKPYIFISIFNLGKTPVDETSLITQILPQQDKINKREKQIDKNADGMNGGVVVSEERSGLTKEEAKEVTDALRRGGTVIIPAGAPQDAIYRLASQGLPADVFNDLNMTISRVYDVFGVKGITPAGIKNEDTVRGKIITKGLDTDRIGGGITEYFEQFADDIFNWCYQLMLVYDESFTSNPTAVLPKISISVKEGSLLPKDATTKANQAIELANAGKMALIDLYKALEYSNAEEMAMNVWLEANAPEVLFGKDPRMQQAMQILGQKQQAAADAARKPPSESISYKDLPPGGKTQMAAQAGLHLDPLETAVHDVLNKPSSVKPANQSGEGRPLPAGANQQ